MPFTVCSTTFHFPWRRAKSIGDSSSLAGLRGCTSVVSAELQLATLRYASAPVPIRSAELARRTVTCVFHLARSIVLLTLCTTCMTCADKTEVVDALLINSRTPCCVASAKGAGTMASAFRVNAKADKVAERSTPRRARRCRSSFRACANRPDTVPSFHPRSSAASALVLPSRQQRTKGARYLSASLATSSCRMACSSRQLLSSEHGGCAFILACLSCFARRAPALLTCSAQWQAARWSQPAMF